MREPIIHIAVEAARAAGKIIISALKRPDKLKIAEKKPNDYVTETDQQAEEAIIRVIRKAYPAHSILGEEGGEQKGNDYQWVIDPIDGTRNFIHGFPYFAISIAVLHKNKIEYGVIYDPVHQELFTATRGKGAFLNEHRIRVGQRKHLADCLFGTGFAYRHQDKDNPIPLNIFQSIVQSCGDVRRAGAAALDLAYVACGRLDGFWEAGLHLWDMAAGILLIKEAGGIVCDLQGGETYLKTGDIAAANPMIIRQLIKTFQPHFSVMSSSKTGV